MGDVTCDICSKKVDEVENCCDCPEYGSECKLICGDCSIECDNCKDTVCNDHSIECEECHVKTCNTCIFTCSNCGEEYCLDHRKYYGKDHEKRYEIEMCYKCLEYCYICKKKLIHDTQYNTLRNMIVCTSCIKCDDSENIEKLFKKQKLTPITSSDSESSPHDNACHICLINKSCVAMIPCGHVTSCSSCINKITKTKKSISCSDCRSKVDDILKIYL